jgi:hypothetical protein
LSDLGEAYRGQSPDGETREEDHNYNNREVKGLGESNNPGKERRKVGIAEEQRLRTGEDSDPRQEGELENEKE